MSKSLFLTKELLDQCLELIRPVITEHFITSVPGRVAAYICVLDPTPYHDTALRQEVFWSAVLGEEDSQKWKYPYDKFAQAKAQLAWRTKLSSHAVFAEAPHLLQGDDFKYIGGVYRNGIVVGTSGLACGEDDLEVSNVLVGMIEARTLKAFNQVRNEQGVLYLRDSQLIRK